MSLSTSEHHNGDDDVEEIVVLLCKDQLQAVQRCQVDIQVLTTNAGYLVMVLYLYLAGTVPIPSWYCTYT